MQKHYLYAVLNNFTTNLTVQQRMPNPSRLPTQGTPIQIEIDGVVATAYAGESVATALMAQGRRVLTDASVYNLARTIFCGMGVCHQCLVTVNGVRDVRACMTGIRDGMKIETGMQISPEPGSQAKETVTE